MQMMSFFAGGGFKNSKYTRDSLTRTTNHMAKADGHTQKANNMRETT